MKHLELILDECGTSHIKRSDTDNVILHRAKIQMLAYKGKFDKFCSNREVSEAKDGFCPRGFEVHHIIPLNCQNTSLEMDNMVVIDKKAHTWLHKNIYTPSLEKCEPGQFCYITLPDIDPSEILTWNHIFPFVVSYERNQRRLMGCLYV